MNLDLRRDAFRGNLKMTVLFPFLFVLRLGKISHAQPSKKIDIQRLLQKPDLDFSLVKTYADLFGEWSEIEKLRGAKK
jgi:hypothetical protein